MGINEPIPDNLILGVIVTPLLCTEKETITRDYHSYSLILRVRDDRLIDYQYLGKSSLPIFPRTMSYLYMHYSNLAFINLVCLSANQIKLKAEPNVHVMYRVSHKVQYPLGFDESQIFIL